MREIVKPLTGMLVILVTIFSAYSTSRYLADAMYGLTSLTTTIVLIVLKVVISLEVLLPSSLFLSVIVGLGRLYKDNEMTALFSSGVSMRRVLVVVLVLSLPVALLAATLSLALRPWAYERTFWLKAKAKAEFDVTRLKAGKFYEIGEGNQVIFIERIDREGKRAEGVFLQKTQGDEQDMLEVVYAKEASQSIDQTTGRQVILFRNGSFYEFPRTGKWTGRVMESGQYSLSLWPKEITPLAYKAKAAPTTQLARSEEPADLAELQWRFSAPFSVLLLALIGVPLSRTNPRKGKHAGIVTALLICAAYNVFGTMAKLGVERSVVPPFIGIWWVQGLLVLGLLILLRNPLQQCRIPQRRQ
jgi:lipopolysaccharide export system permease protein